VARAPEHEWIYSNRAFREMVHGGSYRVLDLSGRPYPTKALPVVRVARERAPVEADDVVIERDDGTRINVRIVAKPITDGQGQLTHIVVSFTDITDEVRAVAEGADARARLQTAVDHAPIILFATDREGTVTLSEGAALAAMGLRPGQLVGQSVFDLYHDNPEVLSYARRAIRGETLNTTVDLGPVVLESWLAPVRTPSGEICGMIGVSKDVTERQRLERQVAQADRLSVLGRLAASVAHEINNPLAYTVEALRLATEILDELGPAYDGGASAGAAVSLARLRRLLGEAAEGADRVRLTVRDLKSFSRGDEDVRQPLDLNKSLGTAIKLVAKRIGARGAVERRLGPSVTVRADENRLVQIFVNLILNAADALPADQAADISIRISASADLDTVTIEIADNGPGVPAPMREVVFEPFFTTKPVGEGTGLGLFVTRNLVTALGGTITVGDAPEGGALFCVRLPIVEREGARPAADGAPLGPPPSHVRVLIIDDDPQVSELLRLSLEREYPGSAVRAFTSARAGLDHLIEAERYDLVFCDLMMGELSGMKIYDELHRRAPGREREVIFMTGGVFDNAVSDFLASVPNDCLDKPFDIRAEVRRRLG
jgi:PAS domain S-box-containing protein